MQSIEITGPAETVVDTIALPGNQYRVIQNTSRMASRLSELLRGGKKANPNVTAAAPVAEYLEAHFLAIQLRHPAQQIPHSEPQIRPAVPDSDDLSIHLSAASADARYIKRLCAGGLGMSPNMVEPLRVLRQLRAKLATISNRWPELQVPEEVVLSPSPEEYRSLSRHFI
jgi:hypothetical protein